MLVIVVFGLAILLLAVSALVAFSFLDAAFSGPPALHQASRQWQPPLMGGNELLAWASATASATTIRRLASPRTPDTIRRLVAEVYEGSMYAISKSPNEVVQRQPDCPSCREQMIGVTPPEATLIADTIRKTMTKREVQRIHDQAVRNAKVTASMTTEEYKESQAVCPLLRSDDSCAVFDARPICCRSWCLISSEDCSVQEGDVDRLDAHAYTVGRGIEDGLSCGLKSVGLDGTIYELNSALVAAIDTPTAAEQWASGTPVFNRCKPYR